MASLGHGRPYCQGVGSSWPWPPVCPGWQGNLSPPAILRIKCRLPGLGTSSFTLWTISLALFYVLRQSSMYLILILNLLARKTWSWPSDPLPRLPNRRDCRPAASVGFMYCWGWSWGELHAGQALCQLSCIICPAGIVCSCFCRVGGLNPGPWYMLSQCCTIEL